MNRWLTRVFAPLGLVLVTLALGACDDSASGRDDGEHDAAPPPRRDAGPRPPVVPDLGEEPDAAVDAGEPDAAEPDAAEKRYQLVIEGEARVTVLHDQQVALTVLYLDGEDRPLQGEVRVRLLDGAGVDHTDEGIDGSRLSRSAVRADAEGRAVFQLTAGPTPAAFSVEASAANADPVAWDVTVTHAPTGTVSLRVTYGGGRYPLAALPEARAALFVNETCDSIRAPNGPAPIDVPPAIAPFDGDDSTVSGPLPHGVRVTAVASAVNGAGSDLAWGCVEGIAIEGGARAEATIALTDLPMQFKGVFQVEHRMDLTSMLEQVNGGDLENLVLVLDIVGAIGGGAGDPPFPRGDGIVQLACERGGLDEAECAPLRAIGAPLIEQFVTELVPPEVLRALDMLGDVYRILADLTVLGEMEIVHSYPDAAGLLPGNENRWQGFRFVWRDGCPTPDDPASCTRDFDLAAAGVGGRTLTGLFDARVVEGDVLELGAHRMRIHLGRLALALAERWLLPAILGEPGPVTLEDLLLRLVPCADINSALPPGDPGSGVCERTIVFPLADQLRAQIEGLSAGVDAFTLSGRVKVEDRVPDLTADHLVDGVWDAQFGDAADLVPGAGTFSGCRPDACEPPPP